VGKTKAKKATSKKPASKKPAAKPRSKPAAAPRGSKGGRAAGKGREGAKDDRVFDAGSDATSERLLDRLHKGGLTLLVEREARLAYASDRGGLRPLYEGIKEHPELFEGAEVADKVIGLAAAYLLAYARVSRVATPLIAKEAERALAEAGIVFTARSRVKELEDVPLQDGVGLEQLARDSVTPATFVEALRTRFG